MPTITETIAKDLVAAMKAHDEVRLRTIRMLRAAFQNAAIAERSPGDASAKPGASGDLSDEQALAVLKRETKKRREAAAAFEAGGRGDLAAGENAELAVLARYLPPEMPEAEVRAAVAAALEGLSGDRAFGPAMKAAMAVLKGRADAALVSRVVKELIG